jgi:flagellar hook-basal body complex protein FliE
VNVNAIQNIRSIAPVAGEATIPSRPGEASFAAELGRALGEVEKAQLQGDAQAQKAALGAGNLHETTIALEQADIAMRVATKVRNKLVETYQEVMRMSV